MGSLNKIISITFFLIVIIVCVTCAPKPSLFRGQSSKSKSASTIEYNEKLNKCIMELLEEFYNDSPLEDLLHGLLNIEYHGYTWDKITDTNQQSYRGNAVLKRSTRYYYLDLFYTALEVGMPKLWTPEEYCDEKFWSEKHYCTSSIEAMGCGANVEAVVCLEKLYFFWKKPEEPYSRPVRGTKDLSNEDLLEAIYRGSEVFRNLTDEELFEAISRETAILESLSDHELSIDFYMEFHQKMLQQHLESRSRSQRKTERFIYDYQYRQHAENENRREYQEQQEMEVQRQIRLNEIRLERYGIAGVSFEDVCNEYIRRKNLPKPFGVYYVMYLHDTIGSLFNGNNLTNREDYCAKYLTELELRKLSISNTSQ